MKVIKKITPITLFIKIVRNFMLISFLTSIVLALETIAYTTSCFNTDLKTADEYHNNKDYSKSVSIYLNLIERNSSESDLYFKCADSYISAKDYNGAIEVLKTIPPELEINTSKKLSEIDKLKSKNKSTALKLSYDYTLSSDKYLITFLIILLLTITGGIIFFIALLPKRDKSQREKKLKPMKRKKIPDNSKIHKSTLTKKSNTIKKPKKSESTISENTPNETISPKEDTYLSKPEPAPIQPKINLNTVQYEKDISVPLRMEPNPIPITDSSDYNKENNNTAYFRGGILFNISPRTPFLTVDEDRSVAYNARYIISDSLRYDLEDPESIKQIKIPKFTTSFLTRDLGYILKMCASREKRTELAVPLVYKAISMMIASPIAYGRKDYFRLIAHLWTLGEIKYADYLYEEVKKRIPRIMSEHYLELLHQDCFLSALKTAKQLDEDYLLSSDSRCVCAESAPYCNRLYCISGKDKRFPKLPDFIIKNKGLKDVNFHPTFYYKDFTITVYEYDSNGVLSEKEVDAIKYSNRPFIDDRAQVEKDIYEIHCLKKQQDKISEDKYFNREEYIKKYYGMLEYREILKLLPDKAPKSFTGYMRMRNGNTNNFSKLVEAGKALNIKFYI